MMKLLQTGQKQSALWLRTLVLLCVALVAAAGTVQACHVHDQAPLTQRGRAVLVAPADECPWCAATHVAMAAAGGTDTVLLPEVEPIVLRQSARFASARWCFEMFGRPPPEGWEASVVGRRSHCGTESPEVEAEM